jgi:uncharacterized membrane protein YkoI
MIALQTFPLDPGCPVHCALFDASGDASDVAHDLVEAEEQDPGSLAAPEIELPPIAVVDEEGRPFTAVRLEREPGTWNFRIVLVAERAA